MLPVLPQKVMRIPMMSNRPSHQPEPGGLLIPCQQYPKNQRMETCLFAHLWLGHSLLMFWCPAGNEGMTSINYSLRVPLRENPWVDSLIPQGTLPANQAPPTNPTWGSQQTSAAPALAMQGPGPVSGIRPGGRVGGKPGKPGGRTGGLSRNF